MVLSHSDILFSIHTELENGSEKWVKSILIHSTSKMALSKTGFLHDLFKIFSNLYQNIRGKSFILSLRYISMKAFGK